MFSNIILYYYSFRCTAQWPHIFIIYTDFWSNQQYTSSFCGSYFDQTQSQDILICLNTFINLYFSNINRIMIYKTPSLEHRNIAENKHKVEHFCAIDRFSKGELYKCLFSIKYKHSEVLNNKTPCCSVWDSTLLIWLTAGHNLNIPKYYKLCT